MNKYLENNLWQSVKDKLSNIGINDTQVLCDSVDKIIKNFLATGCIENIDSQIEDCINTLKK